MADLSKIPIAPNPNGGPPNFADPPSLESTVLSLGLALICISMACLTLRLLSNYQRTSKFHLDDYLCIFGEVAGIGFWGIVYSVARDGNAKHSWDAPMSIVTASFIKRHFASQMLSYPALCATKAAVLALYIRVFDNSRWMRRTCYVLMVLIFLAYGVNIVLVIVYCLPRKGAPWDTAVLDRCGDPGILAISFGAFSVLSNIVLFVLPFPIILNQLLCPMKIIGLTGVYLVGLSTIVTSIMALRYRVKTFLGEDQLWNGFTVTITTFAEIFGTVCVSCAPALYAFSMNFVQKSDLYPSRRPRPMSSKKRTKTDNSSADGNKFDSMSNLKIHNDWTDKCAMSHGVRSGPLTRIYSTVNPSFTYIPMTNGIAKSTRIDQSSTIVDSNASTHPESWPEKM
ncbi:hypothetical protein H112_05249 [Trichophyton rubrum D6]|uniref:Rhodopsin domain-containing protein n=2 Tax=Trichophyton TaxID=5550 RepID=A0A022VZ87_TRIRU|nr:hypothetical protein H100_05271 [Trichophyton rubrum MR850]EZF40778.1 hypothetical protein H102_05261 [Trichophyton rubrum CBS 100081]EZF51395.1 hypothetical protein H103_05262 [Trichophyton rubrum CBS 288.86]EZF62076.1 hypothetical protein H104_05252 [Trichophyton rubrum CBS 289.86]EZF72669.1 hypothetical protein H105_05280 [Trichophyton soudanense CBS 452.61]EZF83449.1 hypothetical protein H110_05259 [Trichophyton rubrum MR1448]EZF94106.1 hypothetical protein H113_05300 [Trichophyton rub